MRLMLILLALVPFRAFGSETMTCNNLRIACQQVELATSDGGFCAGYLMGLAAWGEALNICTPEGFVGVQAGLVFSKWVRENPEHLHKTPSECVMLALQEMFPCSAKP